MAGTALGMATTLVGSALSVASSAAREEMGLLLGVQDDIWFISDELKMMQAFLRAADGARETTGVLKAYLELIRDLAYDIEDCLEEFMVFIKHKNLVQQLLSLRARHRIAVQIRILKQRVQEVSQRNLRYNAIKLTPSTSSDFRVDMGLTQNLAALYVEETQIIGLDKQKEKLTKLITKPKVLEKLEASKSGPRVISIVGMGGLGKTTLTKKVYDSKELGDMFDTRAWIAVSQSFDPKELLKEMIKQLFGAYSLKEFLEEHQGQVLGVRHLTDHLRTRLKERRYLVVLDDVWTIEAWNCIYLSFPEHSKDDSCVVVTTRNHKLAEHCSPPSHIHQPEILEGKDARSLFLKKTNKRPDDLENDDRTKEIVGKILNKCGGLPLAIVTIGGLLANKDTKEWENLYNQLPSELATNPSLEALRQVVHVSYNHLPSHLKPCFLHLSLFPEDFEIERKHLVNRWVAEGFVTNATSRTLEEVAESYFYELISRSMIQPSKLDVLGNVKTCRIHDIVHDIAVSISSQENHVFLVEEHTSATSTSTESIRHISCFTKWKLNSAMDFSRVRSLTMFSKPLQPIASLCSYEFKMLRVLDLKNGEFITEQQDIRNISMLLHLKYLHFPCWYSHIYALPRSIGNLQSLLTLDIRKSAVSTLPTEITKLHNLHSLRCSRIQNDDRAGVYFRRSDYGDWFCDALSLTGLANHDTRNDANADLHGAVSSCWSYSSGIKLPKGVGRLKQLQILEKVDIKRTSRRTIEELGELTQLRKLVVRGRGASKKKCKAFGEAAPKLSSLRSLNVSTKDYVREAGVLDMLVSFTSPLPCLERLKLKGLLQQVPAWVGECVSLVKIDLKYCKFKELGALAQLPNLIQLRLFEDAYDAEKLVFCRDEFPKLRILRLQHFRRWPLTREVTFEQSTSPNMETIYIKNYPLTSGINGIENLPKLKEVYIEGGMLAKQDMLKEEAGRHMNHPVLQIQRCLPPITEESEATVEVTESISEQGESSQS
ncbi:hypothetical protein SETIT_2G076700v2 [Setaria italica]|uniref:Uncharacterized protein n=2 Tax=Setaria italica TaxID=4555 RepID=A0A368PWH0_SETIT|nr:disease resistance protein RPM1 [Setaria italica]RCV10002.1 hypothetical protein SETIT_2G076700v2 [Setaria italica]